MFYATKKMVVGMSRILRYITNSYAKVKSYFPSKGFKSEGHPLEPRRKGIFSYLNGLHRWAGPVALVRAVWRRQLRLAQRAAQGDANFTLPPK